MLSLPCMAQALLEGARCPSEPVTASGSPEVPRFPDSLYSFIPLFLIMVFDTGPSADFLRQVKHTGR